MQLEECICGKMPVIHVKSCKNQNGELVFNEDVFDIGCCKYFTNWREKHKAVIVWNTIMKSFKKEKLYLQLLIFNSILLMMLVVSVGFKQRQLASLITQYDNRCSFCKEGRIQDFTSPQD